MSEPELPDPELPEPDESTPSLLEPELPETHSGSRRCSGSRHLSLPRSSVVVRSRSVVVRGLGSAIARSVIAAGTGAAESEGAAVT